MEGGCPPDCLCNSCLFGLLDALLVAPVSVQRAVLSRALGLEGSSNIAAAPAQPAEGAYVPGRRRSRSHGPPGPSTLGSSHSPINEQRRHSAGSLPSAMGRPRRSPNNDHSPGLDASVPLSSEALSLNEQPILDELEPPPQPQPQVYLYGIHPTLVMDAMRIRDQVPDWLLGYTNYLVPGLNHVIRNLADAGPYRRSGMLEALSMIIQTYAKYYEEFNSPDVIKPEPCSLDHLLVTTYMPEPDSGVCILCMYAYEEGDELIWTPCKHRYHKSCFLSMMESTPERRQCPVCRAMFAD